MSPQEEPQTAVIEAAPMPAELGSAKTLPAADTACMPGAQTASAAYENDKPSKSSKGDEGVPKCGNYTIVKLLGQGGMGKVYLATHDMTGEKVAVKILQKSDDSKLIEYFLRESHILSQLNHPNIGCLKDRGNFKGHPYLAMEYIEGSTLEAILKQNPIAPSYAAQLVYFVLDALEYAANYHIIHRDIKPANIFVTPKGKVKVIDFGLSKSLEDSFGLSKSGQFLGTPYYMPPEQIADAKKVDYRADIYAVGATLYHTLCGAPPFSEYGNDLPRLLYGKIKNLYTSLHERNPELPPEIVKITEKAMAHKPQDRYAMPQEMKQAVLAFYQSYGKSERKNQCQTPRN